MISNITAEKPFRHLPSHASTEEQAWHLPSPNFLTTHRGRRVDTSCLWCDADCMRLRMHMSEKRQHKGVTTMCPDEKEQTNCYHRGGATRSRCQSHSAEATLMTSMVTQRCYPRGHTTSISIFLVHPSRPSPSPPWLAQCSSSISVKRANAFV